MRLFSPIGYSDNSELNDDDVRKSNGFKPKERMASPMDSIEKITISVTMLIGSLLNYSKHVGRSKPQIAPGYLQKQWKRTAEIISL
jgi:ABC-2 type transport system permease protein